MDNFKAFNDAFGHNGGDEIALLLPGNSADVLAARAEQILSEIRATQFVLPDGRRVTVTVSGGLAHASTDSVDLRTMCAAADKDLYQAKELGRNQIHAAGSAADRPTIGRADVRSWTHRPVPVNAIGYRRRGETHP